MTHHKVGMWIAGPCFSDDDWFRAVLLFLKRIDLRVNQVLLLESIIPVDLR